MLIKEPDYIEYWKTLVLQRKNQLPEGHLSFNKREKAEAYDAGTRRKNREKVDALVEFIISQLTPRDTVLDVGAGTGRWTVPLVKFALKVTAIEPAEAMMDILKRNASEAKVSDKIGFISSTWEEANVEVHDIVTCAHAMYMSADFVSFVERLQSHARKRCYLGIRHFPIDGIIQELHTKIFGQPHDSPNFIIAYNALHQMGIYANVLMEDLQHRWTDPTIDSAFQRAKRHLHLEELTGYDELVHETLKRRLLLKDGSYHWPDGMNSALVWWDIKQQ